MELIIVILLVGLAVAYLGGSFYRLYTGKAGCSSGCNCNCSEQSRHMCESAHNSLDRIDFK